MKSVLTSVFLLLSSLSFAQTAGNNIKLQFSPLQITEEASFYTVKVGFELSLSKKISLYNEVGVQYTRRQRELTIDTSIVASKGIKLKTEVRYYFKRKADSLQTSYVAFNIFGTHNSYNDYVDYTKSENSGQPGYDSERFTDVFGVKKSVWGFNFVVGKQLPLWSKKLFADIYAGAGIRFVNKKNMDKEYDKNIHSLLRSSNSPLENIITFGASDHDKYVAPNFTAGVRFCYKL